MFEFFFGVADGDDVGGEEVFALVGEEIFQFGWALGVLEDDLAAEFGGGSPPVFVLR